MEQIIITHIAVGWGLTLVALVARAVGRDSRRRRMIRRLTEGAINA